MGFYFFSVLLVNVTKQMPLLCVSPTAEGQTILLQVFCTGIYLPGFGRWRGRTTTALVFYILCGLGVSV